MNSSIRKRQAFSIGLGISSVAIVGLFAVSFLHAFNIGSNSASATSSSSASVDVNVDVDPTITISTDVAEVNLDVNASNFGNLVSGSVVVDVGTNNYTGYTLSLASSSSNTALLKDGTSTTLTIPTLSSSVSQSTWASDSSLNNRWGFTHNNNGSSSSTGQIPAGTYLPIVAANTSGNTTIKVTNAAASTSSTTVTFATKVDESQPAGSYSDTVVLSATANSNPDLYMQDFTATQCNALDEWSYDSTTGTVHQGDTITLWDRRDNNSYKIRKLADGNCWMTQNLRLSAESLTAAGHSTALDSSDTDLTSTTFTVPASAQWSTWDTTHPHVIRADQAPVGATTANGGVPVDGELAYKRGNYYNWVAAIAENPSSADTSITKTTSICPKGWKLPTGVGTIEGTSTATTNQFAVLYSAYSNNKINMDQRLHYYNNDNSATYAGYWHPGFSYLNSSNTDVDLWSNTSSTTINYAWHLLENNNNGINTTQNNSRSGGFSIRCLLNTGGNQ